MPADPGGVGGPMGAPGNVVDQMPSQVPGFGRRDSRTGIGLGHKGLARLVESQPAIPGLAQHLAQGDFRVPALAPAAADVGMATPKPHFLDRLLVIRCGLPCARPAGPPSVELIQVAIEAAPGRALEPGSLLIERQGVPDIEDARIVSRYVV